MHILILGGTQYVGRLAAEEALARGHEVTLLNRGKQPAPVGVTTLVGDRLAENGYAALAGLHFDAVIDTWVSDATVVRQAVDALKGCCKHYAYVSSISVYDHKASAPPYNEAAPLHDIEKTTVRYFKDKIEGEREAVKSGVPTLVVRPGLIVGPGEASPGRMPWWLRRMERGGPTLAPGPKDLALQFIDGRDLAVFLIDGAEKSLEGTFDIVSPVSHISMEGLLEAANEAAGGKASLCWVDADKVAKAVVGKRMEVPLWFPPDYLHLFQSSGKKAAEAGLKVRPALETVRDTWAWLQESGWKIGDGLSGVPEDVEAAILKEHGQL